jgi:DNA-binding HxlR family transcriptional regulator
MSWGSVSESFCNIARSLSVVGDRWTLLIMREISLGVRRFEEIQAQTGMSSHLLATRLKRLEEDKIVERRVYNAKPLRHEYFATPKGKDLDAVILALRNWDLRWGGSDGKGAASVDLFDKKTGKPIDGLWNNPNGETFSFSNTTSVMSAAWKAEREANVASFYAAKKGTLSPATPSRSKTRPSKKAAKTKPASKTASGRPAQRKASATAVPKRKSRSRVVSN